MKRFEKCQHQVKNNEITFLEFYTGFFSRIIINSTLDLLTHVLKMKIRFYIYTFYKNRTIPANANLGAFTYFGLQIHYTYSPLGS